MLVYENAKKVTQAQFQDAVRIQIDNLYTVYVDVVAARETLRYSTTYAKGVNALMDLVSQARQEGSKASVRTRCRQSPEGTGGAPGPRSRRNAVKKANRTMGLMLDLPRNETDLLQVNARLVDLGASPLPEEELVPDGAFLTA